METVRDQGRALHRPILHEPPHGCRLRTWIRPCRWGWVSGAARGVTTSVERATIGVKAKFLNADAATGLFELEIEMAK